MDISEIMQLLKEVKIFTCEKCRGLLKTNTISFGQELDASVLQQAFAWARNCDLMIVAGSSLVVEPAASIRLLRGGLTAEVSHQPVITRGASGRSGEPGWPGREPRHRPAS